MSLTKGNPDQWNKGTITSKYLYSKTIFVKAKMLIL